ncbi:MAG: glucose/arabinose dehydrogenase, partial [Paraglaciecola sp.]
KIINTFIASLILVSLMPLVAQAEVGSDKQPIRVFPPYTIETLATGLDYPWSLAFLPDGDVLVTERVGHLRRVHNGQVSPPISGLPEDIYVFSQGGLLDVALHPDYRENQWLYLSYASGTDKHNALKLMRAKLQNGALTQQQLLFTLSPDKDTPVHFGGRMTFLPDNTLLLTTGDGFDYREHAQRFDSQMGKIIRLADDGQAPTDNPFFNLADTAKTPKELTQYIFTLGHRNSQAILYDPVTEMIFAHEHGPQGGDEVNIIRPGGNYGWPVITQGIDYSGARISPFTAYPDMLQPLVDWTPSIAPSGMAMHEGGMFGAIKGDLLVSSLKFKQVYWLQMQGKQVVGQGELFAEIGQRLRDIRVHKDGSIYLLTDSPRGSLLRIRPVSGKKGE